MKVVCIGDSHTGAVVRPNYVQFFSELLGPAHTVVNKGIPADTAANMDTRFAADVVAEAPLNCQILGGYNDINTGSDSATVISHLASMYAKCNAATPPIGIIGMLLFPFGTQAGWSALKEQYRQEVNNWINLNATITFTILPQITTYADPTTGVENLARPRLKPAFNALIAGTPTPDNIHLNEPGARLLGEYCARAYGFTWPMGQQGFVRNPNKGLQVVPPAQFVMAGSLRWRAGFLRAPDDRLIVEEDVAGTEQAGFLRTTAGALVVTKTTAGATMQESLLRSPPAAGQNLGKLVVTTDQTNCAWDQGKFRNPSKHLLVAGI